MRGRSASVRARKGRGGAVSEGTYNRPVLDLLIGVPLIVRLILAARWREALSQSLPTTQGRVEQHRAVIGALAAFSLAGIALVGVQGQARFGPALFNIIVSFLLYLAALGMQGWKSTLLHDVLADGVRDAATTALLLFVHGPYRSSGATLVRLGGRLAGADSHASSRDGLGCRSRDEHSKSHSLAANGWGGDACSRSATRRGSPSALATMKMKSRSGHRKSTASRGARLTALSIQRAEAAQSAEPNGHGCAPLRPSFPRPSA